MIVTISPVAHLLVALNHGSSARLEGVFNSQCFSESQAERCQGQFFGKTLRELQTLDRAFVEVGQEFAKGAGAELIDDPLHVRRIDPALKCE